jgi:hypothetical protein
VHVLKAIVAIICLQMSSMARAGTEVTLEIGTSVSSASVVARLVSVYQALDSDTIVVIANGLPDSVLARGLIDGSFDLVFVNPASENLQARVAGMDIVLLAEPGEPAGKSLVKAGGLTAIHPKSPTPEVRALLDVIASDEGQQILRKAGFLPAP